MTIAEAAQALLAAAVAGRADGEARREIAAMAPEYWPSEDCRAVAEVVNTFADDLSLECPPSLDVTALMARLNGHGPALARILEVQPASHPSETAEWLRQEWQNVQLSETRKQAAAMLETGVPFADVREFLSEANEGDSAETLWTFAPVNQWLKQEPPPQKWIFENLLPCGVVGQLSAQGGVGKSFLLLSLSLSLATGQRAFQSFEPAAPGCVLALFGEDGPADVWRRFKGMTADLTQEETELLQCNLYLSCGHAECLVSVSTDGVVQPTRAYHWLKEQIRIKRPELVIIDTQARFAGIQENDNSEASQFIALLTDLAQYGGCTILLAHHVAKQTGVTRGASAFRDGVRWAAEMAELTEAEAERLDIDAADAWRFITLRLTKSSYAPRDGGTMYFRRSESGALEQIQPRANMLLEVAQTIANKIALMGLRPTAQEISKPSSGKTALRDAIIHDHPNASRQVLQNAITEGVKVGILRSETEIRANKRPATVYLPGNEYNV